MPLALLPILVSGTLARSIKPQMKYSNLKKFVFIFESEIYTLHIKPSNLECFLLNSSHFLTLRITIQ